MTGSHEALILCNVLSIYIFLVFHREMEEVLWFVRKMDNGIK